MKNEFTITLISLAIIVLVLVTSAVLDTFIPFILVIVGLIVVAAFNGEEQLED